MKKPILSLFTILLLLSTQVQAQADFGDAPDDTLWGVVPAHFLSLDANIGPKHTAGHLSTYWIGDTSNNTTTHEGDALLINHDYDDGQPFLFVWLIGQPAPAQATIPLSTSASHDPTQPVYINMALDVDQDMDYNTDFRISDNWVIKNYALLVPADTTIFFDSPIFMFGNDPWLFPLWGRITLTSVPVSPFLHWDGAGIPGGWSDGETEDWFYTFGRNPDEYGGNSGSSWGNNGGNNNTRKNPPPNKPKPSKFAVIKYPKTVYVKCGQTKCFPVTVENRGGLPISNINVSFELTAGNPLPGGIVLAPGSPNPANAVLNPSPPNRKGTFNYCVTGWPCTTPEEDRWAKYKVKLSYDPAGIFFFQEFEIFLKEGDFPLWKDTTGMIHFHMGAHASTASDMDPWIGKVDQPMAHKLQVWTGNFPGGARWINSNPDLIPLRIPPWMTVNSIALNADTVEVTCSGMPDKWQNGVDTLTFEVTVTNPMVDPNVDPWIYEIPIVIEFDNSPPTLLQTFPDTLLISTNAADKIEQHILADDPDQSMGYDDFLFVDFYLWDITGDSLYTPSVFPQFQDSTYGKANFSWQPDASDHGTYRLVTVAWDYYGAVDTFTTYLDISPVNSLTPVANQHLWVKAYPNPFTDVLNVQFEMPIAGAVQFDLMDLQGKKMVIAERGFLAKGIHQHQLNLADIPSGAYLLHVQLGDRMLINKVLKMAE